jgi:hypothetical protein
LIAPKRGVGKEVVYQLADVVKGEHGGRIKAAITALSTKGAAGKIKKVARHFKVSAYDLGYFLATINKHPKGSHNDTGKRASGASRAKQPPTKNRRT